MKIRWLVVFFLLSEFFRGGLSAKSLGDLASLFGEVANSVVAEVSDNPIHAERINEVGNVVELLVLSALENRGLSAGRTAPPSGRKKTADYPDLFAAHGEHFFYLEIKTFSPQTIRSSRRTFYISTSEEFKVSKDAFHLLLAFATEEVAEGVYSLAGFKLLDLYNLECHLKLEFNASNRDLYSPESELIVLEN